MSVKTPAGTPPAPEPRPDDTSAQRGRWIRHLANNRDRFRAAVEAGEFYRLTWVKFKIIDGCNIKCVMCNHWRREGYLRSMLTEERLHALGTELAALGARYVSWSGGEPTLRKELPEIIGHYKSLGISSGMVSNGTRLTPDYAGRLRAAGLGSASISLESSDPEVHDRVVGSEGAWRRLVDGVTCLRGDGGAQSPTVIFKAVLTSLNTGPGLKGLVPLAARLGVGYVGLMPVYVNHLRPDERQLLPTEEQIERLRGEYLPEMLEMGRHLGVEVEVFGGGEEEFDERAARRELLAPRVSAAGEHSGGYYLTHACYLPWYHCTIDYQGNVFACCHMRDEDGLVGNLNRNSLGEILRSDTARRLRLRLLTDDVPASCRECAMQVAENQQIDGVLNGAPAA
jgi:radical SAM protein with 4Fe4S-binding SPASM domain